MGLDEREITDEVTKVVFFVKITGICQVCLVSFEQCQKCVDGLDQQYLTLPC